jgi:hypothetical protein
MFEAGTFALEQCGERGKEIVCDSALGPPALALKEPCEHPVA